MAFVLDAFDDGLAGHYLAQLNLGVSIFFVISGFLLYRPFGAARLAGERSPPLLPYAIRRVARIVPAYWVALTIVALWLPVSGTFTAGASSPTRGSFKPTIPTPSPVGLARPGP